MRLAILSAGDGWHVRDLQRAAAELGYDAFAADFRRVGAGFEFSGLSDISKLIEKARISGAVLETLDDLRLKTPVAWPRR